MLDKNRQAREDKYGYISTQHGGFFRHGFVDHAYLYNLYFPPDAVFDHLKNQIRNLVRNYPVAQRDLAELVSAVIGQPASRIIVGNGAAELIKIVSGYLARKMIIPVPSFNEYVNAAPIGHAVEYPLDFPSFKLDVEKFTFEARRIQADIAVVVTPNNPTSLLTPKSDLLYLAEKLAIFKCKLIVDESFIDFTENPNDNSLENLLSYFPNIAIMKSMSKAYGICGLRIGYFLTADTQFAAELRKHIPIWNINSMAEEFLRLLPNYQSEFIKSCQHVKRDRDRMHQEMLAIPGITVYKPDANFIFCRLPDSASEATQIAKGLFIKHHIYVKHCAGKTLRDADRYLRIACRTESENSMLVQALKSLISEEGLKHG